MKKKMRPPLATTKNEGVQPPNSLHPRKIQITQKEILVDNQSGNNHKSSSLNLSNEPTITFEICNEINASSGNNKAKVKFDNCASDVNADYFIREQHNDPIRARINKNSNSAVDQSFDLDESPSQPISNIFVNTFEEDHHLYSSVNVTSIDRNPIKHNNYSNKVCIGPSLPTLPLSETEPLLTNIEETVTDPKRSICLNKNSASLIFTKKDLAKIHIPDKSNTSPTTTSSNSTNFKCGTNNASTAAFSHPKRRHSQKAENTQRKLASDNSEDIQNHHRRSWQFNYSSPGFTDSYPVGGDCAGYSSGSNNLYHNQNVGHRTNTTAANTRKQHAYSWYAPVYSALEEELEQDSRDSSPIHNLANIRKTTGQPLTDNETVSLLETKNHINIQPQLTQQNQANRVRRSVICSVAPSLSPPTINQSQLSVKPLPLHTLPPPPLPLTVLPAQTLNISNLPSPNQLAQQQQQLKQPQTKHQQQQQLLQQQNQQQQQIQQQQPQNENEGPHATSLLAGGPLPRRRRFENFLKSLVGRKPSKDTTANPPLLPSPDITITRTPSNNNVLHDPNGIGLGVVCSGRGSIISNGSCISEKIAGVGSTTSLNTVQQKLWNVVPLLRRENSAASLHNEKSQSIVQYTTGLRKCETVLALTRQTSASCSNGGINNGIGVSNNGGGSMSNGVEQIRPLNRLRNSLSTSNATCSRCSSLLSLAASGSRYSLNIANSGFVNVNSNNKNNNLSASNNYVNNISHSIAPPTIISGNSCVPRKNSSGANSNKSGNQNASSSNDTTATLHSSASPTASVSTSPIFLSPTLPSEPIIITKTIPATATTPPIVELFTCKLCLADVLSSEATTITQCGCNFCTECMKAYVDFEISEGAYEISCPDAQCPAQGIITIAEIGNLTSTNLMKKYHRYRLNREIELDRTRTWCPRAGCETVCSIVGSSGSTSLAVAAATAALAAGEITITSTLCSVQCPTCNDEFCSGCKKPWHPSISCDDNNRRLAADGQDDIGIPFDNDLIKCCPMCAVPIEKDEGCAQMMCKRCKHVFCWYCLASLDDDFLLRHYDKGPCKNKLGHSRASVVWHRAQVIGIFAGFGILLLVASPLLLLAAPCIICCKCRVCSGSGKLDDPEGDFDEAVALQR